MDNRFSKNDAGSPEKHAAPTTDDSKEGNPLSALTQADSDALRARSKAQDLSPKHGFPSPKIEHAPSHETPRSESASAFSGSRIKKDWVVSVDLAVHLGSDTAESQHARLQELAKSTAGSSIALVVQDVHPNSNGQGSSLNRYIISDGAIAQLPTEQAKGFASDAGALLKTAKKFVDAPKTAFIELGHGAGNNGFDGVDGQADVRELASAIVKGNGGKVDDIILDSCLAAENGVLKSLANAAKSDIVATAELAGNADDSIRGLKYEKTLSKLAATPTMDGKQLAQQFIADGRDGANIYLNSKGQPDAGIQNLTAFNAAKIQNFDRQLNLFGETLKAAEVVPGNRAELLSLISKTFRYNPADQADQKRDIGQFAEAVRSAAASGVLKDPDHKMERAAQSLLKSQNDMTDGHYATKEYSAFSGLSAFLPSEQHTKGEDLTDQGLLDVMNKTAKDAIQSGQVSPDVSETMHSQFEMLAMTLQGQAKTENVLRNLDRLVNNVDHGHSAESKRQALVAYQDAIQHLVSDKPFRKLLDHTMSFPDRSDLLEGGNRGWYHFASSLYSK